MTSVSVSPCFIKSVGGQARKGCGQQRRRLESAARSDSGQSRGGFSEQTHGRTGNVEVVGGCGDRCRGRPNDSEQGRNAVGLDYLDREYVGTVSEAGGQDG
jgi:hypothetical protein